MELFGTSGGCYMRTPIQSGTAGISIKGVTGVKWLVPIGWRFSRKDSKFVQRCFNSRNFVYGFGQDIGELTVQTVAMVVTASDAKIEGADFGQLERTYIANSLSEVGTVSVDFRAAKHTIQAFLIEMNIETQDALTNIHACNFSFMILDPPAGIGSGSLR